MRPQHQRADPVTARKGDQKEQREHRYRRRGRRRNSMHRIPRIPRIGPMNPRSDSWSPRATPAPPPSSRQAGAAAANEATPPVARAVPLPSGAVANDAAASCSPWGPCKVHRRGCDHQRAGRCRCRSRPFATEDSMFPWEGLVASATLLGVVSSRRSPQEPNVPALHAS